jgi:hypothetical protein
MISETKDKRENTLVFRILAIAFPVVILGLVFLLGELILSVLNFGVADDPMITIPELSIAVDNSTYTDIYHMDSFGQTSGRRRNAIQVPKPENTFRIAVVGGSTAQGFPYQSGHSFSHMLKAVLTDRMSENIEVLNFGASAMSSYYVKDVTHHLPDYEVDLVILYTGHNEFFGTVNALQGPLVGFFLGTHKSRVVQLFHSLFQEQKDLSKSLMTRQFEKNKIDFTPEHRIIVAERYYANLSQAVSSLLESDIDVIFIEPVSNIIFPPFGVESFTLDNWRELLELGAFNDPDFRLADYFINNQLSISSPEYSYLLGVQAQNTTGISEAIEFFEQAVDRDTVPFRWPKEIQASAKRLMDDFQGKDGFAYIPLKDIMLKNLGYPAISYRYFADHLHFNLDGHRFVAGVLARFILNEGPEYLQDYFNEYTSEALFQRIRLSPLMIYLYERSIQGLYRNPMFTENPIRINRQNYDLRYITEEERQTFEELVDNWTLEGSSWEDQNEAYFNYLVSQNDKAGIGDLMAMLLYLYPGQHNWYTILADLIKDRNPELSARYHQIGALLKRYTAPNE